jgi:hypothetical protein
MSPLHKLLSYFNKRSVEMEKTFCIYKHTNLINNKVYIGQTSQSPERRWRQGGTGYKDSPRFWQAI